jgi:Tfp pilus assembly protein PilF
MVSCDKRRFMVFPLRAALILPLLWVFGANLRADPVEHSLRPEGVENPLENTGVQYPPKLGELFDKGWAKFLRGDSRGAEKQFGKLLKKAGNARERIDLSPVKTALGYALLFDRKFSQAEENFLASLKERPGYRQALLGLAHLYYIRGDWMGAYVQFQKTLALFPGEPFLKANLDSVRRRMIETVTEKAEGMKKQGNPDGAVEVYEKALRVAGQDGRILFALSRLYGEKGDSDKSLSLLKQAVEAEPSLTAWRMVLAEAYEQRGELENAEAVYRQVLDEEPANAEAARRYSALREKRRAEAIPPGIQDFASKERVTRAEMAVLLYTRIPEIAASTRATGTVVVTDIYNHWARSYIQDIIARNIMEVYTNHTFNPDAPVKRYDLALACAAILNLFRHSGLLSETRGSIPPIVDVPEEHLLYKTVKEVLQYKVMDRLPDGTFGLYEPVDGKTLAEAVDRLRALVK